MLKKQKFSKNTSGLLKLRDFPSFKIWEVVPWFLEQPPIFSRTFFFYHGRFKKNAQTLLFNLGRRLNLATSGWRRWLSLGSHGMSGCRTEKSRSRNRSWWHHGSSSGRLIFSRLSKKRRACTETKRKIIFSTSGRWIMTFEKGKQWE